MVIYFINESAREFLAYLIYDSVNKFKSNKSWMVFSTMLNLKNVLGNCNYI